MKNKSFTPFLFCLALGIILSSSNLFGQQNKEHSGFYFTGGYLFKIWKPLNYEDRSIWYNNENLNQFKISTNLGFLGYDYINLNYQGGFNLNAREKKMIEASNSGEKGIESFKGYLFIRPIVSYLSKKTEFNFFIERVLSLRYKYNNTLYYGQFSSDTDFGYIPYGTEIESNLLPDETQFYNSNSSVEYKTYFRDSEIYMSLFDFPMPLWGFLSSFVRLNNNTDLNLNLEDKWSFINLGYFSSSYNRVSDYWSLEASGNTKIFMEQKFVAKGISIGLKSAEPEGSNGLDAEIVFRSSTEVEVFSPRGRLSEISPGSLKYKSFLLNIWYNENFWFKNSFVTMGMTWENIKWIVKDNVESDFTGGVFEGEDLISFYFVIAFR